MVEWKNVSTPKWHENEFTYIDADYVAKNLREGETYRGDLYLGGEPWGFGSEMPDYQGRPRGHVKVINPPVKEHGCDAVIKLVRVSDEKVFDEVTKRIPEHNGLCEKEEFPLIYIAIGSSIVVAASILGITKYAEWW